MTRLAALVLASLAVALAPATAPAAAKSRGRILASGDSMIQIVDSFLRERLKPYHLRVKSDDHIGTGLSKPFQLNWPRHARRMARRYHPRATVVFLGANEGFSLKRHGKRVDCCSHSWTLAYAWRVRKMMRALERGGRSRVYWLTLPAARSHKWNRIYRRVNQGIEIAARAERDRDRKVELVDMRPIFTPNGHFRRTMKRHGRRIVVRQSDGIHLNRAGAAIAARVIKRALRRDGVLG
jgi:hypothetical protein